MAAQTLTMLNIQVPPELRTAAEAVCSAGQQYMSTATQASSSLRDACDDPTKKGAHSEMLTTQHSSAASAEIQVQHGAAQSPRREHGASVQGRHHGRR